MDMRRRPPPPEPEPDDEPVRGMLWALGPSLVLWGIAVLLIVRACTLG
jgi:hypothetical protein